MNLDLDLDIDVDFAKPMIEEKVCSLLQGTWLNLLDVVLVLDLVLDIVKHNI